MAWWCRLLTGSSERPEIPARRVPAETETACSIRVFSAFGTSWLMGDSRSLGVGYVDRELDLSNEVERSEEVGP